MKNINIKIKLNLDKKCENLLANADVGIDTDEFGVIVMKDFQIWKSPQFNSRLQDAINIQPPVIKYSGKFRPRIFFENKEVWFELESQIWYAFQVEGSKKESAFTEIIIPDETKNSEDMPF